jgi:hypothetical protein
MDNLLLKVTQASRKIAIFREISLLSISIPMGLISRGILKCECPQFTCLYNFVQNWIREDIQRLEFTAASGARQWANKEFTDILNYACKIRKIRKYEFIYRA